MKTKRLKKYQKGGNMNPSNQKYLNAAKGLDMASNVVSSVPVIGSIASAFMKLIGGGQKAMANKVGLGSVDTSSNPTGLYQQKATKNQNTEKMNSGEITSGVSDIGKEIGNLVLNNDDDKININDTTESTPVSDDTMMPEDQQMGMEMATSFAKYGGRLAKYMNGGKLSNYNFGGKVNPSANLKEFIGKKHEQGGINVGTNGVQHSSKPIAEVEGGETMKDGYVYSDSLMNPKTMNTFAGDSKIIDNKYNKPNDYLKYKTGGRLMSMLQKGNDKERNDMMNMRMKMGGQLPKYNNGGQTPPSGTSYNYDQDAIIVPQGESEFFNSITPQMTDLTPRLSEPTLFTSGKGKNKKSRYLPQAELQQPLTYKGDANQSMKMQSVTSPTGYNKLGIDKLSAMPTKQATSISNPLDELTPTGTRNRYDAKGNLIPTSKLTGESSDNTPVSDVYQALIKATVNPKTANVGDDTADPSGKKSNEDNNWEDLTLGDKIQMGSNFIAPTSNLLIGALNKAEKEPQMKNSLANTALTRLRNLRYRENFNPIHAQANALREAVSSNYTGSSRLGAMLAAQNQTNKALSEETRNIANMNTSLLSQLSQTELGQGERDRAEKIRAKGVTDMNKAARFEFFRKALEQVGPAVGTIGSGLNNAKEVASTYNILKEIYPDITLKEYREYVNKSGKDILIHRGTLKQQQEKQQQNGNK
jgi:hypothetical protein